MANLGLLMKDVMLLFIDAVLWYQSVFLRGLELGDDTDVPLTKRLVHSSHCDMTSKLLLKCV